MSVVHRITGYDRPSERSEREFDAPGPMAGQVRPIADAPVDCRQAAGAFPSSAEAVRRLAAMVELPTDIIERYDWFLEPFEA